ncbi:MAG: hypothetical protein FJX66_05815 [Alphaproteobacteria bacterium]|nr:hypothetical protein [Alphaproteobacteria bacterium]
MAEQDNGGKRPLRMIQFGMGAAGGAIIRLARSKGVELVGAIDADPAKLGKDAGELAGIGANGVKVTTPDALCRRGVADVMFHATRYRPKESADDAIPFLRVGVNFISISGVSYLPSFDEALARAVDAAAREGGATALGTGLNPGLLLDAIPMLMSSACEQITLVHASRVADFSPWGPETINNYGMGLWPNQFEERVASGQISLHAEISHSIGMIAHAMGGTMLDFRQERLSIVSKTRRVGKVAVIEPGQVCGFRHIATARSSTGPAIKLEHCGVVRPDPAADGVEPGTRVRIEGMPNIDVQLGGELNESRGVYAATVARAVNAMPYVIAAPPGLTNLANLPMMAWWGGSLRS